MTTIQPQRCSRIPANTPPAQQMLSQKTRPHPRRPPAHRSVSLLHTHALPATTKPVDRHNGLGDGGESSDAAKWFERSNNCVTGGHASLVENDPPFFLRRSSSEDTTLEDARWDKQLPTQHANPLARLLNMQPLNIDGSSIDEFRCVIDDLTIENKKLKKRLRRYEHQCDAHLQDDKLFEIRVHGLSDIKKRELEGLLQSFSAGLGDVPTVNSSSASFTEKFDTTRVGREPGSCQASTRVADSAYASASVSGQNSSTMQQNQKSLHPTRSRTDLSRQHQHVQSYLHDIPIGLLPKPSVTMTEKARKKLVVQRLEQIFAGKGAAVGGHQQPIQQQEVARTAATADRVAVEQSGRPARAEGSREALIMPKSMNGTTTVSGRNLGSEVPTQQLSSHAGCPSRQDTSSRSPDQRPTRPLDLDPHRAQVPEENMDYIRHLGFSPPRIDDCTPGGQSEEQGWIYLNLLTSMAQLHTINVTPGFVRDAVENYSSKFVLSRDGQKIRWKGGDGTTQLSKDNSSAELASDYSPDDTAQGPPHKRLRLDRTGSKESVDPSSKSSAPPGKSAQDSFAYTPLFYRQESQDRDEDSSCNEPTSWSSAGLVPESSCSHGFDGPGPRTSSAKRRLDDGPIIFYNRANFYTDLSGDRQGLVANVLSNDNYSALPIRPVGSERDTRRTALNFAPAEDNLRGPLETAPMAGSYDEMDVDGAPTASCGADLSFPSPDLDLRKDDGTSDHRLSPQPMEFEASGLGNVQPDDNFEITVQCRQVRLKPTSSESITARAQMSPRTTVYPKKIRRALEAARASRKGDITSPITDVAKTSPNEAQSAFHKSLRPARAGPIRRQIISTQRRDLPASVLPPASCFFDATEISPEDLECDMVSSDEETLSRGSSQDVSHTWASRMSKQVFPSARHSASPGGATSPSAAAAVHSEGDRSSVFSDNDGSIDFLATARDVEPEAVLAQERAYDAHVAERAAEIPDGSSAASAGGGNGIPSATLAASGPVLDDSEAEDDEDDGRDSEYGFQVTG